MRGFLQRIAGRDDAASPSPTPVTGPAAGAPAPDTGTADDVALATASPGAAATPDPSIPPRNIDARDLRALVRDGDELRKGAEVYDRAGLQHLARHGDRVFSEASGSGSSPYRVTLTLPAAGGLTARCSCMAARSRPVCKHAAALLVAWARAPESFVVGDAPPPGGEGTGATRRAAVKTGKVATATLQARGIEQAVALVRELAVTGVATAGADRPEQIRSLAETLRANRLRRLSARVAQLADLLTPATRGRGSVPPLLYADTVADVLLTARRIERHLAGETLEDRQLEELIGRNWRKADRTPLPDLCVIEVAYRTSVTADGFTIRERRLVNIATGSPFAVKQILPAFMARRTPALPSQPGVRQAGVGLVYPSYPPQRLDVDDLVADGPVAAADVERLLEGALATPALALAAFQDHRRDIFAPDDLPVTVAVEAVVALGDRLAVVGADGSAVLIADGDALLEALGDRPMRAIVGELGSDGILAVLRPMAAIAGTAGASELVAVVGDPPAPTVAGDRADWLAGARAAGASSAALSLAEVRDELAFALTTGLTSLDPRLADGLVARLTDLGLERPAGVLREAAARPDPADRLDDVVRLHQVLGVAAIRLASTRTIDLAALVPVPTLPAVRVADPGPAASIAEVRERRRAGTVSAHEAALLHARAVAALPVGELLGIQPWWPDGGAAGPIAAAVAGVSETPWPTLDAAVAGDHGMAAALTAIRVLEAIPTREADQRLTRIATTRPPRRLPFSSGPSTDPGRPLRVAARLGLRRRAGGTTPPGWPAPATADPETLGVLVEQLTTAGSRDRRAEAAEALAELEDPAVVPILRRAWRGDPMAIVRDRAARGLASLGDLAMVGPFVAALDDRARRPDDAKAAAYALGSLADRRGVDAIVDALVDGWKSSMLIEILVATHRTGVVAIVDRALAEPAIATRRGVVSALEGLPAGDVRAGIEPVLARLGADAGSATRALTMLRLAGADAAYGREVALRLQAHPFDDCAPARALAKAAAAVLAPPKPRKPS